MADQRQTKKTDRSIRIYTTGEEIAHATTHGLGILVGISALVLMTSLAIDHGGDVRLASALIFGSTLVLEYTASTLYHALCAPRAKRVFKVLDHASIYLLIAGTYTPFCLITLGTSDGLVLFWLEWILAIAGVATEAFWVFRPRWVSVLVYLAMGWLIVFKIGTLLAVLAAGGLILLLGGGICYTLGTIFYILKKVRYMHAIWHLWVLAGSVCHILSVLLYVL
ncbi:MAG: hemolysin III family protein [Coriobacteriales bacterium]|jgi:hemolysin III|nr:hemolysin III family protein [Coriobacteriales bacterium]